MTTKELIERLKDIQLNALEILAPDGEPEFDSIKSLIADLKNPVVYEVVIDCTDLDIIYRIATYKIQRFSKPRSENTDRMCVQRLNYTLTSLGLDAVTIDNLKFIEK